MREWKKGNNAPNVDRFFIFTLLANAVSDGAIMKVIQGQSAEFTFTRGLKFGVTPPTQDSWGNSGLATADQKTEINSAVSANYDVYWESDGWADQSAAADLGVTLIP